MTNATKYETALSLVTNAVLETIPRVRECNTTPEARERELLKRIADSKIWNEVLSYVLENFEAPTDPMAARDVEDINVILDQNKDEIITKLTASALGYSEMGYSETVYPVAVARFLASSDCDIDYNLVPSFEEFHKRYNKILAVAHKLTKRS